jgi:hypothetical protein
MVGNMRLTRRLTHRRIFWLGFVTGLASLTALSIVAFAGGSSSSSPQEGAATPPLVAASGAMSVFAQPRTAADRLPSSLDSFLATLEEPVAESLRPGGSDTSLSHRLLADVGSDHGDVYALPTDKGGVCFALTSGPYGGCVDSFGGEAPIPVIVVDPDQDYTGQPSEVFGVAPDSAVSIDVIEAGTAHPAQLRNNGYFDQLSNPTDYAQAVVANYRDGSSARVDLHAPPPPH